MRHIRIVNDHIIGLLQPLPAGKLGRHDGAHSLLIQSGASDRARKLGIFDESITNTRRIISW